MFPDKPTGTNVRLRRYIAFLPTLAFLVAACGAGTQNSTDVAAPAPTSQAAATVPAPTAETDADTSSTTSRAATEPAIAESAATSQPASFPNAVVSTVAGGQIDFGSLEGQDIVLWFWAPW